jgi:hypothetical protein
MKPQKETALELSSFKLAQANFEVRFQPSLLHWDRAGVIWTQLTRKYPGFQVQQANPNHTSFLQENRYKLDLVLDKANVAAFYPEQSLREFTELLENYLAILKEHLEIREFIRIGFRPIYEKQYSSLEKASAALLTTNLLNIPNGPNFGVTEKRGLPEYIVRLEDDTRGARICIRVQGEEWVVEPPPQAPRDLVAQRKERQLIVFDIDYYTVGTVSVGQFSAKEWIKSAIHVIKRDSDKFLGGFR